MWLAFATQIFFDIHHILRKEVERGFADLSKTANYVESTILTSLKSQRKVRIDNRLKSNDKDLVEILDLIEDWVKTDAVRHTQESLFNFQVPNMQVPNTKPFQLLKYHPLYCGLLSYRIKALAQDAGMFSQMLGAMFFIAHTCTMLCVRKDWYQVHGKTWTWP